MAIIPGSIKFFPLFPNAVSFRQFLYKRDDGYVQSLIVASRRAAPCFVVMCFLAWLPPLGVADRSDSSCIDAPTDRCSMVVSVCIAYIGGTVHIEMTFE